LVDFQNILRAFQGVGPSRRRDRRRRQNWLMPIRFLYPLYGPYAAQPIPA